MDSRPLSIRIYLTLHEYLRTAHKASCNERRAVNDEEKGFLGEVIALYRLQSVDIVISIVAGNFSNNALEAYECFKAWLSERCSEANVIFMPRCQPLAAIYEAYKQSPSGFRDEMIRQLFSHEAQYSLGSYGCSCTWLVQAGVRTSR